MACTAIYLITSLPASAETSAAASSDVSSTAAPSLQSTLLSRLGAACDPSPLPPYTLHRSWSLNHRLFRSTHATSTSESSVPERSRNLQVIYIPHVQHSGETAVGITQENSTETALITLPGGAAAADFMGLIQAKFGPLWQSKQTLNISSGLSMVVGKEFIIRIGEVKSAGGNAATANTGGGGGPGVGTGTAGLIRGVACEIEWRQPEQREDHSKDVSNEGQSYAGRQAIEEFWKKLGCEGSTKHVVYTQGLGVAERIKAWMEILRVRI